MRPASWLPALLLLVTIAARTASGGKSCRSRSDCGEREFCVDGTCRCPVLFEGMGCTTPRKMPSSWCLSPFKAWPLRGYNPKGVDLTSCAVVASSGVMKGSGHGRRIDSHTAVFRFNEAPTRGHTSDVGSKTSIRLQNKERGGFAEKNGEKCVVWKGNLYNKRKADGKCSVRTMPSGVETYAMHYWQKNRRPGKRAVRGQQAKLSNGFLGVVYALHMCGRVSIFGYSQGRDYYFKKFVGVPKGWGSGNRIIKSRRPFGERHHWTNERDCIRLLSNKLSEVRKVG